MPNLPPFLPSSGPRLTETGKQSPHLTFHPPKENLDMCPFFPTGGLLRASCRGGSVAGFRQGLVSAGSCPGHEVFQSIVLVIVV